MFRGQLMFALVDCDCAAVREDETTKRAGDAMARDGCVTREDGAICFYGCASTRGSAIWRCMLRWCWSL